jgi:Type II secretory pathway, prepilin signal peptidase PulO and related peptidases
MGSFSVAQVWRLRFAQLSHEKKSKTARDVKEYKRLSKLRSSVRDDRSKCLDCGYLLRWHDLIPILSWISLKGHCRKCGKKIGYTEILAEVVLASSFVLSLVFWPFELDTMLSLVQFTIWLAMLVILTILFVYDLRWQLLPNFLLYALLALSVIFRACDPISFFTIEAIANLLAPVVILSGVYLLLYFASKGKWVGSGDWILALPLAIILENWLLAFMVLFLANLIGSIIAIPIMATKKLSSNSSIPLGPLLILAFVIVFFSQGFIIELLLPHL